MKRAKLLVVAALVFGLLAMAPTPASAERFADLYLGVADTLDEDVTVRTQKKRVSFDGDFDTSLTLGGRIGYWGEGVPSLGLALDASIFVPDLDGEDLTVVPLSLLFMLRAGAMKSEEFPKGQIQPYVGIGPGLFISELEVDSHPVLPANFSDTSVDIGLDVRAGLKREFRKNVGAFLEYRFTHVRPEFKDLGEKVKTRLNTHYLLVGISFRF